MALSKALRQKFPGPPLSVITPLGNLPQFLSLSKKKYDNFTPAVFNQYFEEYGDTYVFNLGLKPLVLTRDVELMKWVMSNDPEKFSKGTGFGPLTRDTFGESILMTEGAKWHTKRSVMTRSAFKKSALEAVIPHFWIAAQELGDIWTKEIAASKSEFDVLYYFTHLTLDIIGRTSFGYNFEAMARPGGNTATKDFNDHIDANMAFENNPIYQILGVNAFKKYTPVGRHYAASVERLKKLAFGVIQNAAAEKKTNPKPPTNLLEFLLEILENEKKAKYDITLEELVDEILLFIVAGYEQTASLLSWALYYINRDPKIKERVLSELSQVGITPLSEKKITPPPSWSQLNELPYFNQVLKETLRINPSVPGFVRETINQEEYKGIVFPAGTTIFPYAYAIHKDKRHWGESVNEFNPDNFNLDDTKTKARSPFSWCPFGAGARNCIGLQFAMLEARAVLAYLLTHFHFTPTNTPKLIDRKLLRPDLVRMKIKM